MVSGGVGGKKARATVRARPSSGATIVKPGAWWEGETLVITLPLPSRALSPNKTRPGAWWERSKAARSYREMAQLTALSTGPLPCWEGATMHPTFYWPDARKRDDDNAAANLKSARDGFADAGLVKDDSAIRALPPTFMVDKSAPRVVVALTPIHESGDDA